MIPPMTNNMKRAFHMTPHDSIVYWIETGCSLTAHCTGPPPAKVEVPAPVQVMLKPHSESEKGAVLQHVTTTTL